MKGVSYTLKINLNKDKFKEIDNAFSVLIEDQHNKAAVEIIEKSLAECFKGKFTINVVSPTNGKMSPFFIMSVFPEMDTISKIINVVSSDGNKKDDIIRKMWEKNTNWVIEIDERIFDKTVIEFTPRELTALLMHEIGHVAFSNSVPYRITTVLQYEIAQSHMENKILLKDQFFRKILSLPILNACVADGKSKDSIKFELKADKFAKKMGYSKELFSVLNKLLKSNMYPKGNPDKDMAAVTKFSMETIDQLRTRQDQLMKRNLISLKKECASPYIESVITDFYNTFFQEHEDSSMSSEKKLRCMNERVEYLIYTTESLLTRKLEKIDPATFDYIDIKIQEIKSESDKMMIVSYIHSKLDIVEYYISILNDPKLSKKYIIPYSIEQLEMIKKKLLQSRANAMTFRIPERQRGLLIAWPENYDG